MDKRKKESWFQIAALTTLLLAILGNGWVSDDAFFTFRTLDNLLHGHGLRFDPDMRVQAFTNPLWLFLHLPVYVLWGNMFYVSILVSCIVVLVTLALLTERFRTQPLLLLFCLVIPFLCSKAMLEYSTSGLENPFTFLCITVFAILLMEDKQPDWFSLSLFMGLAGLNRLDSVLFFLPALALLVYRHRGQVKWLPLMAGPGLIGAWLLFSLFYYGVPFPNTKYAKLHAGTSEWHHIQQGIRYLIDIFNYDLATALMLVTGFCITLYHLPGARDALKRPKPSIAQTLSLHLSALGMGGILYSLYIVYIGGDFMSGRFWSGPWMMAAVITCYHFRHAQKREAARMRFLALAVVAAAMLRLLPQPPDYKFHPNFITDERAYYESTNTFLGTLINNEFHFFPARIWVLSQKKDYDNRRVLVFTNPGTFGYYAGAKTIFIDPFALGDPLLARLPKIEPWFRIGHFRRELPKGYEHARNTGDTSQMHPDLAEYYRKIVFITSGPLFSWERIKTVIAFNLGAYEHLRLSYLRSGEYPLVEHFWP